MNGQLNRMAKEEEIKMAFKIKGQLKGKPYLSKRIFPTSTEALGFAYKKVYKKDGNTKRADQLSDFYLVTVKSKKKKK